MLGAAIALTATRPARLGLDLQGGTQIVLEARPPDGARLDGDTVARTLEVLRRRVDQLGVAEPSLQRSGDRRIIVELPGLDDPAQAVAVIGRTAQLTFHPVVAPGTGERTLTDEDGAELSVGPSALTGADVRSARAGIAGEFSVIWDVQVDFRNQSGWAKLTGEAACSPPGNPARRIAIVLDEQVVASPQVSPGIECGTGISGGATSITGNFTEKEAKELALLIRAGALPVPVEIVEQRTVGPSLGAAAIRASVEAALIGAALTALFLIAYYRLLGALAVLALVAYGAISFAVLLALGATLTLPGIAGFVLAIGMAVDANVLVFERIKEEHGGGATVRRSAENGFKRAWTAIADSNATTLLAAVLLFFLASGAVRGFGITLSVGVAVSVFTTLVVTRLMVDLVLRTRLRERSALLGFHVGGRFRAWIARRRPDLLRRSGRWLAGSTVAVALAVTGIASQGFQLGLDFSGGRLAEYDVERPADLDAVRRALASAGFPRAVVQESGDANVAVRTGQIDEGDAERLKEAVESVTGPSTVVRDERVGPTIGNELRRKALIAVVLALLAQLAYISIRFKWTYASAAVIAMAHDVALLLGIFAWLGKTLDGVFLAALLTVVGYSINDSVVVFDRIRELRRARPGDPMAEVANDACLQTVPRTINTGLGALFILVALYALGGDTLSDFALALLIGILVGTYSSVFTATPLAVRFENLAAKSPATRSGARLTPSATRPGPPTGAKAGGRAAKPAAEPRGGAVLVAEDDADGDDGDDGDEGPEPEGPGGGGARPAPPRVTPPGPRGAGAPRPRKKRRKPARRN